MIPLEYGLTHQPREEVVWNILRTAEHCGEAVKPSGMWRLSGGARVTWSSTVTLERQSKDNLSIYFALLGREKLPQHIIRETSNEKLLLPVPNQQRKRWKQLGHQPSSETQLALPPEFWLCWFLEVWEIMSVEQNKQQQKKRKKLSQKYLLIFFFLS